MRKLIFGLTMLGILTLNSVPVLAISEKQKAAISDNCEVIREDLKNVQKMDVRARIFLGSRYETVLAKFITPLNIRLVENNLSNVDLIENQNEFAIAKSTFAIDFINYQQDLENLITIDCRMEPGKFYDKLAITREKRKIMVLDIAKMKDLAMKNVQLTIKLKESL